MKDKWKQGLQEYGSRFGRFALALFLADVAVGMMTVSATLFGSAGYIRLEEMVFPYFYPFSLPATWFSTGEHVPILGLVASIAGSHFLLVAVTSLVMRRTMRTSTAILSSLSIFFVGFTLFMTVHIPYAESQHIEMTVRMQEITYDRIFLDYGSEAWKAYDTTDVLLNWIPEGESSDAIDWSRTSTSRRVPIEVLGADGELHSLTVQELTDQWLSCNGSRIERVQGIACQYPSLKSGARFQVELTGYSFAPASLKQLDLPTSK